MFYAHSVEDQPPSTWQPLRDHLVQVSECAAEFAAPLGLARPARLAGLLHDLGKYTPAFQRRLAGGERVDHSTAGAWALRDLLAKSGAGDRLMAEVIGYAILGHHAGLPDRTGDASYSSRLDAFAPATLDPAWTRDLDLDLTALVPKIPPMAKELHAFSLSMIGRMVFSCLVDADYRDTERFYDAVTGDTRDRDWPKLQDILPELITRFDRHMAEKASGSGTVNPLRGEILTHVRAQAALGPGLFTLTVPTGGGKTLASLGFALDHAARHGHGRIIYAIPFTSIIDQTAAIFRDVLGEGLVLEHHSAIEEEKFDQLARNDKADQLERRAKLRLAMEDWAAPVVVTTNVQLFESLFSGRPARCRKLHNIAGSIIVLDEAQTLPRPLMIPCVRALDELARTYGCTIILCTATQPALDERDMPTPGHPLGLKLEGRELAPDPARLARDLRRVTVRRAGVMSNAHLIAALADTPRGLVIVNSRRHALDLYKEAKSAGLDGLVHLTTRQHAADRREILADVRESLAAGLSCRVIATSLVEAGVDVDFPLVWRAEAGLDQIAHGGVDRNLDQIVPLVLSDMSPPSRRRGSKLRMKRGKAQLGWVASLAEAWIETHERTHQTHRRRGRLPRGGVDRNIRSTNGKRSIFVASLAEAWIETDFASVVADALAVASLAEAWIETTRPRRGAKRCSVASLAEAWIETPGTGADRQDDRVASLAEAWIETPRSRDAGCARVVASLAEAWIETARRTRPRDRVAVASLAEAWIETSLV